MRRLRDFQPVLLQSGDEGAVCRVVAKHDTEVVLRPDEPGAFEVSAQPARATISFTPDRHPVLLSGYVDGGPLAGTLRFSAQDPTGVPEPRQAPRMPLDVPAVVKAAGAPLPRAARTVDVARGGVLLTGWTAAEGTAVTVLLTLPGGEGRLEFDGRVVRTDDHRAAVAFVDVSSQAAEAVAQFVLDCRRQLAGLLAERAAERAAALS